MKRRAVVGIVAGAVVMVAGVSVALWAMTRPPSIESAAQAYLDALSSGDFATIETMLPDVGVDVDVLEAAFTSASGHIEDVAFEVHGDDSVRADVVFAGEPGVIFFALAQQGGRWVLASDFLASLEVTTTLGDSVRVGDALVPAGRVALLPAEYSISAAPAGILEGEAVVALTNEHPVTVALEASLAPAAAVRAQEQVDVYATACAAPATSMPEHCGIVVPWAADLASLDRLAFRVEELPAVELAADGASWAAVGGVIVATAHGATHTGGPGSFTYRADDWALRGSIRFEGDEMVLAVR